MGKLSPYTIQFLRDVREYLGVTFKIVADEATHTTLFDLFVSVWLTLTQTVLYGCWVLQHREEVAVGCVGMEPSSRRLPLLHAEL